MNYIRYSTVDPQNKLKWYGSIFQPLTPKLGLLNNFIHTKNNAVPEF
jgi:hypothetical protein